MSNLKTEVVGWAARLAPVGAALSRARTSDEAIAIAAKGLEGLGLSVAVIDRVKSIRFRHLSPAMESLSETPSQAMVWLETAGAAGASWSARASQKLPSPVIVMPLGRRPQASGVLVLMEPTVTEAELPTFAMFGGLLGASLELMDASERLERQSAELELVHELALVGPRADSAEVSERVLSSVCRSTQSQAAALHRFDGHSGEFVMVGNAYGPSTVKPLAEKYRRFTLPKEPAFAFGPVTSAELLPNSIELRAVGFVHTAVVPLFIERQPVGLLTLGRSVDHPYTDGEMRGAAVLGVQMASLLERARLYDEASQLYIDLKKSYDELARTQAELVRHERLAALGELAAVMAHEVRNPLGVIFNSLTTLKRLLHPTGDAEMLLTMVGEEADRLNRIVADLLDFARPYELTKKPIDIEPIIASAIDAATKAVNVPLVRVVTEIPRPLTKFPVDSHFMRQGLVNLLVNAVQSMPKGGTVTVRATIETENGNDFLVIDVRDEGVGLSPRAAEKMFQPFFTTKATGTGLGLAVVKRIVDAHQGEVSAQVNPSGHGTTFRCRFPNLVDRDVAG